MSEELVSSRITFFANFKGIVCMYFVLETRVSKTSVLNLQSLSYESSQADKTTIVLNLDSMFLFCS